MYVATEAGAGQHGKDLVTVIRILSIIAYSRCIVQPTRRRMMYSGQCLCGGIRFEISGALEPIQVCYCKQCQRAQGTALATNIPVTVASFRLLSGSELLRSYESSPGKLRCFCGRCGSPIYSKRESLPDVLRIRVGLLDGELATHMNAHFYTSVKPNWWTILDDLPQYAEGYVAK